MDRRAHTLPGHHRISPRIRRSLLKIFCMACMGLGVALVGGCITENQNASLAMPILLLERQDGATHVVIYPDSADDLGNGVTRYSGPAFAQIAADPQASREPDGIHGNAIAIVDEVNGERQFSFEATEPTDMGWGGIEANELRIEGSGPPSAGTVLLDSRATLSADRAAQWGFSATNVDIRANLSVDAPIFTISSESGQAGNPIALVGAPNPGGLNLQSQAMGLIFAPVNGETPLGAVEAGNWVKFVVSGNRGLADGAILDWDRDNNSLRGSGAVGNLTAPGATVDAVIELTATSNTSYLDFSGYLDPPQLGILNTASGRFWTDSACTDCGDMQLNGGATSIGTINIPSVVGTMEIRGGNPTRSIIAAHGVNGSIGPVVIDNGDLSADFSDPANLIADLAVSGRILGIPITTTFRGPFSFDLSQLGVNLTGDLYLNISEKVVLAGELNAAINMSGVNVVYNGDVRLPGYGTELDVQGNVSYDITHQSLRLDVGAQGHFGPISIVDTNLSFAMAPSSAGGIDITGTLVIGSATSGSAALTNVKIDVSGNTNGAVTAYLNSASNRALLKIGDFANLEAFGSIAYDISANSLTLQLQFEGRIGSWQGRQGSITANWPGSGNVTGTLTVGQVSNGQVTIANSVIDFTASSSSVNATLRPTNITAGTLVSATVSGNAAYNLSSNTLNLNLSASGRVGSINVTNVQATVNWPLSGNVSGSVSIGNVSYGSASLQNTTIGFNATSSSVNATIGSTLNVGDPFRLTIGLSGNATYNLSTNTLNVALTTGSGTMWGKPISGSVSFNINITGSSISGSANTSSLRFSYDQFGISLSNTALNFSVNGSNITVSGTGNVAVNGPMGNGWLSGSGSFSVSGNILRSTNYRITLNNVNKTITWVDVGPRNGAPLSVDIIAGSLSYDASGKMSARVNTGFPFYCQDLEFQIHAWGDQNVLRVDFEGSWVIGLFGARGHMDVYNWLSSTNPPMYGYADVRITFFWFRYQTWNGQSFENGGC